MSTLTITRQRRQRLSQIHNSARQRSHRLAFGFGFVISAGLVAGILVAVLAYANLTYGLPSLDELSILLSPKDGQLLQPTRFYDRSGQHLIAVLAPTDGQRVYALYDQLPLSLIDAIIAAAQPDFWSSPGYVLSGWQDPGDHATLAQRLASDFLLGNEPETPLRAIHERMLAAQITAHYGRQQVLEWYINSADYGHYAYGAEAAAQFYFGKSVTQIDLGEAALLAALSQAPSIDPSQAPQVTEQNRLQVLRIMLELGMADPAQVSQAVLNPPPVRETPPPENGGNRPGEENPGNLATGLGTIAPSFVNYTLSQLDLQFGPGRVERGGLIIITSLDYELQLQALCTAQTQLERLNGKADQGLAADGSECTAASLLPAIQPGVSLPGSTAEVLLFDPQTGQVLAAVGDLQAGMQNPILVSHPAGTIITPFIYLTAFSRGLGPASLGWDIPEDNPLPGQVYHGPVRLRTALDNDYLPPALSLLAQMGQESVQGIASSFGLDLPDGKSLLQQDFNLSPLELAQAYGTFANTGVQAGLTIAEGGLQPVTLLKVSGIDHSVWADWNVSQSRLLLSPQLAYMMNQVLSDETARWPSLGHPNPLEIGRPTGAKLGLALDLSGVWSVGYTPQRVGVVWLGLNPGLTSTNQDNQTVGANPYPQVATFSADLWHALMQYSLRDMPAASWEIPPGIVKVAVCDPSGLLPTSACPNVVNEIFLDGRQPVQSDTLYQTFQVNAETGLLATVFTLPELVVSRTYLVVPAEASIWSRLAGFQDPPSEYDTVGKPPDLPETHITTPALFADGRGKIEIIGSADGSDFVSYRLEFGQGLYPLAWTQIESDNTAGVTEGLLGEWDTTGLDGLYSLRLMVVRSGERVDQAVEQVTLDNSPPQVVISYPQDGQIVSLAQEPQLALLAQASDPFLVKVDFYVDGVRVGSSTAAPFGVVWAARSGDHVLRVVATDRAGNIAEARLTFTVGN